MWFKTRAKDDVQWKNAPQTSGCERKRTVADSGQTSRPTSNVQKLIRQNDVVVWLQCLLVDVGKVAQVSRCRDLKQRKIGRAQMTRANCFHHFQIAFHFKKFSKIKLYRFLSFVIQLVVLPSANTFPTSPNKLKLVIVGKTVIIRTWKSTKQRLWHRLITTVEDIWQYQSARLVADCKWHSCESYQLTDVLLTNRRQSFVAAGCWSLKRHRCIASEAEMTSSDGILRKLSLCCTGCG